MSRQLLFSVSIDDCRVDTFRSGGKGGQHQNKTDSGVRVVHPPSGAVGESREHRSQLQNKRAAFIRMTETKEYRAWHRITVAKAMGMPSIEEVVEEQMKPENLRVEVRGPSGRWVNE